ncbi:hypothetical protein HY639_03365 [Candidatus Woesearchaeota archaeon]|nr:hypothetical protein [Candidatus Woesearchaeota archaeon]
MNWMTVIGLVVAISVLASGLTAVAYTLNTYHNVVEYRAELEVVEGKTVGLNVENSKVYFGKVPRGGASTREIQLKNPLTEPTQVTFSATGEIAQFVSFPTNDYELKEGEKTRLYVEARVPEETPVGMYTGSIFVYFRRK